MHNRERRCSPRHVLYKQIFASFVVLLLLVAFLTGALIWHYGESRLKAFELHGGVLLSHLLPAAASREENAKVLQALRGISGGTAALYAPDGRLLQANGEVPSRLNAALVDQAQRDMEFGRGSSPVTLDDGRTLILEWNQRDSLHHFFWLAVLLLVVAAGAYPVARRLTRRIEALQRQAEAWGQGNLAVRADEHGRDEIAALARAFNQAAERIEALLASQRSMLAAASHELRSPLARIRVASDLIGDERPDLQTQIAHDIAELDDLIGDLLLASRLSSETPQMCLGPVDLLGLAAEEAARCGAELDGDPLTLNADAKLLRRLLRNLLENSRRHAPGSIIELEVHARGERAEIRVLDRGPGVAEGEREKVFEPFYRIAGSAETGQGVGYGLALVRRIARLHGGDARCLPRQGGGACFAVSVGQVLPEQG